MTDHKLLTMKDVASILNISIETVWRWARTGFLPVIRIKRSYFCEVERFKDFIESNYKK